MNMTYDTRTSRHVYSTSRGVVDTLRPRLPRASDDGGVRTGNNIHYTYHVDGYYSYYTTPVQVSHRRP